MAEPDTRHRSFIRVASVLRLLAVAVLAGVFAVPGGSASASVEESYRMRDGVAAYLGVLPAQEGVLNRVFGVGDRAEHAVGHPGQAGPMGFETLGRIGPPGAHLRCHRDRG